ncbi:hypothetical protein [Rhizobium sp. LCM 4573]|uniref:hypothetical protein n=1 Tax=Rhizobium sp. LCM 4573 TaxID=1848291 RepID=UPI0008D90E77|nr:hypothetical protein [Rhizobium sp. LCM 4573]OHV75619.1 hypothetical protein LCM4573_15860 [Rhizobium sp. LCM 4573]
MPSFSCGLPTCTGDRLLGLKRHLFNTTISAMLVSIPGFETDEGRIDFTPPFGGPHAIPGNLTCRTCASSALLHPQRGDTYSKTGFAWAGLDVLTSFR